MAIDSSLFKQWLKNMESETGILRDGSLYLKRVLIQVIQSFKVVKFIWNFTCSYLIVVELMIWVMIGCGYVWKEDWISEV